MSMEFSNIFLRWNLKKYTLLHVANMKFKYTMKAHQTIIIDPITLKSTAL